MQEYYEQNNTVYNYMYIVICTCTSRNLKKIRKQLRQKTHPDLAEVWVDAPENVDLHSGRDQTAHTNTRCGGREGGGREGGGRREGGRREGGGWREEGGGGEGRNGGRGEGRGTREEEKEKAIISESLPALMYIFVYRTYLYIHVHIYL